MSSPSATTTPKSTQSVINPRAGDPLFPVMSVPPSSEGIGRTDLEKIRDRTRWGIMPARIGARVAVRVKDADGEYRTKMIEVRAKRAHRGAKTHAVCVTCGMTRDTAQEIVDEHVLQFGNEDQMRAGLVRHVYAEWSDDPTKRAVYGFGEDGKALNSTIEEPIGLLSDVEANG